MRKPSILVAPLDWGLGHAARCIPIVNELIIQGWEVSLAGSGSSLFLLQQQFPHLRCFPLKGYDVFYHSATGNLSFTIARQIPKIWAAIRHEHRRLRQILTTQHFDVVLSDNRYGLYAKNVHTVFITHQLAIRSGLNKRVDQLLRRFNYRYIQKFNECWIPDFGGDTNIAGELSHPVSLPPNARYIGPLSRLSIEPQEKRYDIAILLSGPEPSRTCWENKILDQLLHFRGKALLVRGVMDDTPVLQQPGIHVENMLPATELNKVIQQSEWIICRSGYTSVMDLLRLQKKAILVPTPGQPEQEYLAHYLQSRGVFYTVAENRFSLELCLAEAALFPYNFKQFGTPGSPYREHIAMLTKTVKEKIGEAERL
ncbi:MAG: glycosyl transferase family 28 [Chitinophagaceae bacterium]|nr:glycosyl transferase family 28 [Chitinophagaceae bacterium]